MANVLQHRADQPRAVTTVGMLIWGVLRFVIEHTCGIVMPPLMSISLLALAVNVSAALAQDGGTAQAMLPHCMAALKPDAQSPVGGRCMGIIATLSFVSRVLPDDLKFCHPNTATPEQILQAITSFMNANPDVVGQDFRLIALAAMRNKWPCQD
jgi:hypothetical protein